MELVSIRTQRKLPRIPSFHLIFEWEDIISRKMNIPLKEEGRTLRYLNYFHRFLHIKGFCANNKKCDLVFDMNAKTRDSFYNQKNIIPCIVDFYLTKRELPAFRKAYSKNPFCLISSLEAYNFIKENMPFFPCYHLPLSISDLYAISEETTFKKEYDLVLFGRQNPFLESCLNRYIKMHPEFSYVYRKMDKERRHWYYTNKGKLLGEFSSRQSYISLLKQSRIALYSTPGIDGGEKRTHGFNQVTPRFLEILTSGCHVIMRYPKNADTEYYQLSDFCASIESYEQFEMKIKEALSVPVPINKHAEFLNKHYTSVRVEQLKSILEKYNQESE